MRGVAIVVATIIAAPDSAEACSGVDASIAGQFPADSDRIGPDDAFAVHLVGELYRSEPRPVITNTSGQVVDRTFATEMYSAGLYSVVFFFRPTRPLPPGHYQFRVRYETRNPLGDPIEVEGPASGFEVLPAFDRLRISVRAAWDLVDFDEVTGNSCFLYLQLLSVTLEGEPRSDEPLWLLVEVEGHARPGADPSETEEAMIVPTRTTGGTGQSQIVVPVGFEADCVTVIPISLNGPVGDPFRTCQPERCLSLLVAETDPFEEIDLSAAEPCEPRSEEVSPMLATEEPGCGCTSAGGHPYLTWMLPILMLGYARRVRSVRPGER